MISGLGVLIAAVPLVLQQPGRDAVPGTADSARRSEAPRAVVWEAVLAVEGDSAHAVGARWEARLGRAPSDRAALLGLATLDRLSSRYEAARRRYRSIIRSSGSRPDAIAAYARTGLASLVQASGDQRAAAAEYALAARDARAAGETAAEVQALLGIARARSRLEGPAAALALLDSIAPRIPDDDLRLRATYGAGRAAILAQVGRADARAVALECVDLARRARAPRAEVACYQPLAMDAERRGDTRPAIELLGQVAQRNRAARDRWALANTLQWQGHLLSTRGEYGRAREILREAVGHGEAAGNGAALAWASLRLARISRHLQDHAAAAALVARSVDAFRHNGDVAGAMEAHELQVTLAADAGDYATAHRLAAAQLDWARRAERPRLQFTAFLAQSTLAERVRDWPTALARLDSAAVVMRRNGMTGWSDVLLYQRGRIALRRGELDEAEAAFRAQLALLDTAQHVHRYRTRARLAHLLARRGELARAEQELDAAGDELDAWRATLTDHELRVAAFQLGDDEDVDLGVPGVIAALAADGQVRSAFALAERRRARALAERLVQADALRATATAAAGPDSSAVVRGLSFAPFATASAVAWALPDERTALLEYVTGHDDAPTTLLVISRRDGQRVMRAVLLPPAAQLAPDIARLVTLLEAGGDPSALARSLGERLLDPALAHLDPRVTRLIVVPDGPLHRLPFDALRLPDGRYAVERFAVSGAPSAAIAVALLRTRRPSDEPGGPVRLLAFGDPVFAREGWTAAPESRDDVVLASRAASDSADALPRLAESGREARLVAGFARGAVVRLREEASEAYLKTAPLSDFRVLHFATHALVDERTVARTALALAPGGGESGFVTPGDLAALRLTADLVVLSACRTAGGVVVTGEGVQGLTAPFLQAGARAVVATGWRIDDRRTVDFVERLYAGLALGLPVTEALRAAKLDALRRGRPPGEWAAFTVVGDPLVTVPLRAPASPAWMWWTTGGVAIAAAGMVLRRRVVR